MIIDRVGEKHITNKGFLVEIVEYFNNKNCTLKFEDGTLYHNASYKEVLSGKIAKPVDRVGEKYTTKEGYEIEIIEYFNYKNCTIAFKNGIVLYNRQYGEIVDGRVRNPYHPSVYNVGYIGAGSYKVSKEDGSLTESYIKWYSMIRRVHNNSNPSYKSTIICEEWYNFQNFAKWFEENWKPHMKDWQLDKDLLSTDIKLYSPITCCFLPKEINFLLAERQNLKGFKNVRKNKKGFSSIVRINGCFKTIGMFNTEKEASDAYVNCKNNNIKEVADRWKGLISDRVYEALYNFKYKP